MAKQLGSTDPTGAKSVFTNEQLKELFPLHILIKDDLSIVQTGNVLNKLVTEDLEGRLLTSHFSIEGLRGELNFSTLHENCNKLVYLESVHENVVLKGGFYKTAVNDHLLFAGNIHPKQLNELQSHGIALNDFPVFDSFNDFMFSHRANAKAYDEVQELLGNVKEQLGKFRLMADTALDALITLNERQEIVMFNPAAELMFGYAAAEIKGKGIEVLIPMKYKKGHGKLVKGFEKSKKQGKQMNKFGIVYGQKADGSEFPIETSLSKMEIEGKMYFNAFVRDVTERVESERKLSDQHNRLKKYAFVTSHNLRRPISTIQGLIGAFNFEQPEDPVNKEVLAKFEIIVNEMDDVTRQAVGLLREDELLESKEPNL